MNTKPAPGAAHLRWVVSHVHMAAANLGVPIADLSRAKFLAEREGVTEFATPNAHDCAACGGWGAVRTLAAAEAEGVPSRAALGEQRIGVRENARRRAAERALGDSEATLEGMREALAEAVRATPPVISELDAPGPAPVAVDRCETVVLLSDWHFGMEIDPLEVPGARYDWTIAARRLALMCEQAATFKPHHRRASSLRLLLGGDIIEGELHGRSPHIDFLAAQIDGARQLLTSAIDFLRHEYDRIDVVCVPGNHGRWVHRGPGRATDQKWDSLVTTLYRGLEAIFREAQDVTWTIPRTPFAEWTAPGGEVCALTHGDTVINAGSPGRRIEPASIADKVREWNAERARRSEAPIRVLAHGHTHVPYFTQTNDGVSLIGNGCGCGTAPYAQSFGTFGSNPTQIMWEAVPGHPVGDLRVVQLEGADDRDELDTIVPTPRRIGEVA